MTQVLVRPVQSFAVAGFVLGCVASVAGLLVPRWTLTLLILVGVPGLLAIIFGLVASSRATRLGVARSRLAVWAVVLGFAPVPLWLLTRLFFGAVFGI